MAKSNTLDVADLENSFGPDQDVEEKLERVGEEKGYDNEQEEHEKEEVQEKEVEEEEVLEGGMNLTGFSDSYNPSDHFTFD